MFEQFDEAARRNQDLDPMEIVLDTSLKVIALVACGDRINENDSLFLALKEYDPLVWKILGETSLNFALLEILPCLRHSPLRSSRLLRRGDELRTEIVDQLKQRALSRDREETLMGSLYQHAGSSLRTTAASSQNLTEDDIFTTSLGILFSGRSTSGVAFTSLLNLLAHHQNVQDRIGDEISSVSQDPDQYIKLKMREDLPYTRATIMEALRYQTVVPVTAPHKVVYSATTVNGMRIPEKTNIMCNFWGVHHDESFWDDPAEFRPERFLDPEGHLLPPSDSRRRHLMSFGAGVRSCPGEQLALSRLFLWLANTCKKFRIFPGTGNTADLAKVQSYRNDFVMYPPKFRVSFQRR